MERFVFSVSLYQNVKSLVFRAQRHGTWPTTSTWHFFSFFFFFFTLAINPTIYWQSVCISFRSRLHGAQQSGVESRTLFARVISWLALRGVFECVVLHERSRYEPANGIINRWSLFAGAGGNLVAPLLENRLDRLSSFSLLFFLLSFSESGLPRTGRNYIHVITRYGDVGRDSRPLSSPTSVRVGVTGFFDFSFLSSDDWSFPRKRRFSPGKTTTLLINRRKCSFCVS